MANNEAKELAIMKKDILDVVAGKIGSLIAGNELDIPRDYSPSNAMKSAWLMLQGIETKAKKPVLTACTRDSIANSLLSMVIQGLSPEKSQVYFIAYGNELSAFRSYFGSMAVAKRVNPRIADFSAQVVYVGDTLEYGITRGRRIITNHLQSFENVNSEKIAAAYCMALGHAGEVIDCELMTLAEIKQSWKQSRMNPVNADGEIVGKTHKRFTGDMCMRTVINKLCKRIINTSSDASILQQVATKVEQVAVECEVETEIAQNANKETITTIISEPAPPPKQEDTSNPAETTVTFDDLEEKFSNDKAPSDEPSSDLPPFPGDDGQPEIEF